MLIVSFLVLLIMSLESTRASNSPDPMLKRCIMKSDQSTVDARAPQCLLTKRVFLRSEIGSYLLLVIASRSTLQQAYEGE